MSNHSLLMFDQELRKSTKYLITSYHGKACYHFFFLKKATAARPFPTMERDVIIFLKKKTTAAKVQILPNKTLLYLTHHSKQTHSNLNFSHSYTGLSLSLSLIGLGVYNHQNTCEFASALALRFKVFNLLREIFISFEVLR